jgi:hypothetical protein
MEGGIQNCTDLVDLSAGVSKLVRAGDRFCKVELCEGCVGPVWGVTLSAFQCSGVSTFF